MLGLSRGMTLYHGSYTQVDEVDLSLCRPGKDFGRGFYLTTSDDQARRFSLLSARKHLEIAAGQAQGLSGFVSSFRIEDPSELSFAVFADADRDWLHFVAGNRRKVLFEEVLEAYADVDVIAGKIANDQTARTLQLYIAGAYGAPGSDQADSIAIAALLPNRLENQYCFRTRRAIDALEFVGCEVVHA